MKKLDFSHSRIHATFILVLLIFFGITSCISGSNRRVLDPADRLVTQALTQEVMTKGLSPNLQPTITHSSTGVSESPISSNYAANVDTSETSTPVLTTASQKFEVCSPLASEKIELLWEIISDPYDPPPPGREERHQGVDFSYYRRDGRIGIEGEEIRAILPGTIVAKVNDRLPYGNMIIIETPGETIPVALRDTLQIGEGESLYHLYAHMKEESMANLLDDITCGQKIGIVGTTGYNVVNAHLHLETRIGPKGTVFDTMVFYDTRATTGEMDNYRRWRTGGEFVHFDPMSLFMFYLDIQKAHE